MFFLEDLYVFTIAHINRLHKRSVQRFQLHHKKEKFKGELMIIDCIVFTVTYL